MKYYHGTDRDFKNFDLNEAKDYRDFGRGIYLAKDERHAKSISLKRNGERAFVRVYDIDMEDMRKNLNVREFKKTSVDWVKFVLMNRNEIVDPEYDVVIGATADARAQDILEQFYIGCRYRKPGKKDYRELISRLEPLKYSTQVCLLTQKAIDYVETKCVEIIDIKGGDGK